MSSGSRPGATPGGRRRPRRRRRLVACTKRFEQGHPLLPVSPLQAAATPGSSRLVGSRARLWPTTLPARKKRTTSSSWRSRWCARSAAVGTAAKCTLALAQMHLRECCLLPCFAVNTRGSAAARWPACAAGQGSTPAPPAVPYQRLLATSPPAQLKRSTVVGAGGQSVVDTYRTSYGMFIKCASFALAAAVRGVWSPCRGCGAPLSSWLPFDPPYLGVLQAC